MYPLKKYFPQISQISADRVSYYYQRISAQSAGAKREENIFPADIADRLRIILSASISAIRGSKKEKI